MSANQTGNTAYTSFVQQTYNSTTNKYDYTFNMPSYTYNTTTNNYYEQYDITNIYRNEQYNTYNFDVTNEYHEHKNFYVTYSPTFVYVTYLDSAENKYVGNAYFYQLPNGRNSWDMTADEVHGMYFIYNAVNYDMAEENTATMALYHFDGNFDDSSSHNGKATYLQGASYNYLDAPGFGSALYWDSAAHSLQFSNTAGGGTYEWRMYLTQNQGSSFYTGNPFVNQSLWDPDERLFPSGENPSDSICKDFDKYLLSESLVSLGGFFFSHSTVDIPYPRIGSNRTRTVYFYRNPVDLVSADDVPVLQLVEVYSIDYLDQVSKGGKGTGTSIVRYTSNMYTSSLKKMWGFLYDGILLDTAIPVGSWAFYSYDAASSQLYINGMAVQGGTGQLGAGDGSSGLVISKPAEYANYMMLDEVRVSQGSLYSGNYIPQAHPFDSNAALVLPASGVHGDIAFKTIVPVGVMRVGGARPTYPSVGDVFVQVEKDGERHLAKTAQQYQNGGWVPVDAAIYVIDKWVNLKDFDLAAFVSDDSGVPAPNEPQLRQYTGTTIRFNGPENAIQKIVVHGKTYEVGQGEKGPENPYQLYGVPQNPVVKVNGQEYVLPTSGEMFESDYRSSDGAEYRQWACYLVNAIDVWDPWGTAVSNLYRIGIMNDLVYGNDSKTGIWDNGVVPDIFSTHLKSGSVRTLFNGDLCVTSWRNYDDSKSGFQIGFYCDEPEDVVGAFSDWLDTQNDAGTPFVIYYRLENPFTYQHDPTVFTNAAGEVIITSDYPIEVWALTNVSSGGDSSGGGSSGSGSGGTSGSGGGSTPQPGDDGFWDWVWGGIKGLGDLILKAIGGLLSIIGQLVSGVAQIIASLVDLFASLGGFTTSFGNFVGESFSFIPAEIIGVIVLGLGLAIVLMIVRFIRG